MAISIDKAQRIDITKADLNLARETAQETKKRLLEGRTHSIFDKYEMSLYHKFKYEADTRASIGKKYAENLTALADEANGYISATKGTDNNCLYFALQCNAPAEERAKLVKWYKTMFANVPVKFPDNVDDAVVTSFNNDFGAACQTKHEVVTALTTLKKKLTELASEDASFFKYGNITDNKRMLETPDILLVSALLRRTIQIIKRDGGYESINAEYYVGAPFKNDKPAACIQYNGNNHYQGLKPNGVARYEQIETEKKQALETLEKELSVQEDSINGLAQLICEQKNADFKCAVIRYANQIKDIVKYERSLAVEEGRTVTSVAAQDARPIDAALLTEQMLAMHTARDLLKKSLSNTKAVAEPDKFISTLHEKHRERDTLLKNHALLVSKEETARRFKEVLVVPGNLEPVDAGKIASRFKASNISPIQAKILKANVDDVSAAICGVEKKKKRLEEIENILQISKELPTALKERDEVTHKLQKLEADVDRLSQANALTPEKRASFEEEIEETKKMLDAYDKKIYNYQKQLPKEILTKGGVKAFQEEAKLLNVELSVMDEDRVIIASALEAFQTRLKTLSEEQLFLSGVTTTPLDLQWAAILNNQLIKVVKKDGSLQSFSPDIFADVDPATMRNPQRLADAKTAFYKLLNTNPPKLSEIYIYHNEEAGVYQVFTEKGQEACNSCVKDAKEKVGAAKTEIDEKEKEIENHLSQLGRKNDPLDQQARAYSLLLQRVTDAIRQGKPLDATLVPGLAQKKQSTSKTYSVQIQSPTISVTEQNMRDLHRQNIDALFALYFQGSPAARTEFMTAFNQSDASIINFGAAQGAPFDREPTFYTKALTQPALGPLSGKNDEEKVLDLMTKEIDAYRALKQGNKESELANDYLTVLAALEMGFLAKNDSPSGLAHLPPSVFKPLMDGIHTRTAAKAGYVANMIDHNAFTGALGATSDVQRALRKGISDYRQAVSKQPLKPSTEAPKPAHSLKCTSFIGTSKPPRVVFDVKGMTIAEVMDAFNLNTDENNKALTVKNDKDVDCRIVAREDRGRLKLVLQDDPGNIYPLTTSVWKSKGAETAVTEALKKITETNAELTTLNISKPRNR